MQLGRKEEWWMGFRRMNETFGDPESDRSVSQTCGVGGARAREVADRAAGDLREIDVINSTTAGTIQTSTHTQTNPSRLT